MLVFSLFTIFVLLVVLITNLYNQGHKKKIAKRKKIAERLLKKYDVKMKRIYRVECLNFGKVYFLQIVEIKHYGGICFKVYMTYETVDGIIIRSANISRKIIWEIFTENDRYKCELIKSVK